MWTETFKRIEPDVTPRPVCAPCKRVGRVKSMAVWWKWIKYRDSKYTVPVPYCTDCRKEYKRTKIAEKEVRARAKLKLHRARRKRKGSRH